MSDAHQLARLLDAARVTGPAFVHADLMQARRFVGLLTSRDAIVAGHWSVLSEACGDRPWWTPTFNYDFCRSGEIDLRDAPSQVGPLGQAAVTDHRTWRSTDPVFSIAGAGEPIPVASGHRWEAFGAQSGLMQVYERDGVLLFYGARLNSATILHIAEALAGGPLYRYDKVFPGSVVDSSGTSRRIQYVYHVRPMGWSLDYDWKRLRDDLHQHGIVHALEDKRTPVFCIGARALVDYWVDRLNEDPLYLLNATTRDTVEQAGIARGQRVTIEQFEPAAG